MIFLKICKTTQSIAVLICCSLISHFTIILLGQNLPPFAMNGNASQLSTDCYLLTSDAPSQAGSIWNESPIDLTQSFEAEARLYLGCTNPISCFEDSDDGADGIVFAFQPISTSVGSGGGGMGILGVLPSLFIEFDTYPNADNGDPSYDHISIGKNGDINHSSTNSLTPFVPMIDATSNAEDCNEHILNVRWDAPTQTMSVYFDCALKVTYTGDIINEIFNGNPNVFWGFTSATGGCTNEQRVCINIPPTFQTNDVVICAGESVQLIAPNNGVSYLWTPIIGLDNPTIPNPIATPDTTTTYQVAISNSCDFIAEFAVTITVNPVPVFELDTTICEGEMLIVGANIYMESGNYTGTIALPNGCDSLIITHLTVMPNISSIVDTTVCIGMNYVLPDLSTVNQSGIYTITIPSVAGCDSTITVNLTLNNPDCNDNDCTTDDVLDPNTCTCAHIPLSQPNCSDNDCTTTDSYNTTTCTCEHTPISPPECNDNNCNTVDSYNLSTCNCENIPLAPPNCDDNNSTTTDTYNTTTCNCEHTQLTSNNIIIPSAFSPNGDGINDELRVISTTQIVGVFRIYNRWGQSVFETNDLTVGWNGKFNEIQQEIGVYVYFIEYTNLAEPTVVKQLHGNVTLVH